MRHVDGINELYEPYEKMKWRTGRRVGQCVHAQVREMPSEEDVLLFEAPSPRIALLIVAQHNESTLL
jgi:hypothetical protein